MSAPSTWFAAYLLFVLCVAILVARQNYQLQSPYNLGDWLINYSGGFVRRGLPGAILLLLSRMLRLSPMLLAAYVPAALFAALCAAVWLLVRPMPWKPWTVALAFSPATFGFVVLSGGAAFRKDLLFLLLLAVLLLLLRRGMSNQNVLLYLSASAVLIALSHEGLIVYWPYLLAALAISRQSLQSSVRWGLFPTALLAALTLLVGRHPGNLEQAKQICSSVDSAHHGLTSRLCSGSIAFLAMNSGFYRSQVAASIRTNHYLRDYGVVAILALLPCAVATWQMWRLTRVRSSLLWLLLWGGTAALCSGLLFMYAIDWGRWIYINIFSLMLLFFFLEGTIDRTDAASGFAWPRGYRAVLPAILLVLYFSCWHVPVTGYEHRGWGYIGSVQRHLHGALHRAPLIQVPVTILNVNSARAGLPWSGSLPPRGPRAVGPKRLRRTDVC